MTDSRLAADMGRRIVELRKLAGWSQSGFAKRLSQAGFVGAHQTTISRIEQGSRPTSVEEAYIIADVLGVPLDALTGRSSTALAPRLEATLVNAAIDDAIELLTKARIAA